MLLSSLTGMQPLYPTAIAMMFELGAYGAFTGLFHKKLRWNVYPAMVLAMLIGRAVSGCANAILLGVGGKPYGMAAFLSGAFVTSLPGILIQLLFIPLIVIALEKSGLAARMEGLA